MEKFIDRLVFEIEKIGGLGFSTTEDSITVQNNSIQGFNVTLYDTGKQEYIVNYGHYWHGHFEILDEAVNCFMSGVTGCSRLRCTYHWRYLVKTISEVRSGGGWQQVDEVGSCLGLLVWWMPRQIKILQNNIEKI